MKDFKNKVAAITGAASGMGRTLALELARRGCHLSLSDVNEKGLAETAAMASKLGVKVTTAKVNVADREAMVAWADQTAREHGKVNLIFNNAGVALGAFVETVKPSDFEWIMGINFWGVVWGTQAFLPHLKKAGEGHIVNTSSLFGLLSVPTQGTYNASKFAVRGFTEALRQELDMANSGVSATCVHPGGIRTNIAKDAKMDESMHKATGGKTEEARAKFDKLLNATTAESAALQILRAVECNKRRVLVGLDAKFLDKLVRVLGSWYQPLITLFAKKGMLG
ncbi:SDR family oxidoreductase [Aquabacterium sp.]|jgi:NAD(P)-dependent dehydrogenase (short-subunit alcohol dehydrogenase family)|uniref:SDR family NAD(P)-dependent oxidoreductase n=1 Tax=Aquabacterium sp. TaxID=1872578 RepID=UPI0024888115|nr:SDR family NAD(P)-dependent oxidoreductase [Aquabacterium sp.]MDI1348564.1 SDR family NAD(P)-dependent oxidoreductase [Aquabacterium sp.]